MNDRVQVAMYGYADTIVAEWSDVADAVIVRFGDDVKVRMSPDQARALAVDLDVAAVAGEHAASGCEVAAAPVA